MNKLNEYKKMDVEALKNELKELKQELFKLRFSHAMNGLDNPQKMVDAKRNIARVNTLITMKNAGKEVVVKESTKTAKKTAKKEAADKKETKKAAEPKAEKKTTTKKAAEKKETKKGGND